MLTGAGSVTEQGFQNIRKAPGIDRSFAAQYPEFFKGIFADFGRSFAGGTPVPLLIGKALPSTGVGPNFLGDRLRDYLDPTGQTSK